MARLEKVADAVREYLARDQIHDRKTEMNLTSQQAAQVRTRRMDSRSCPVGARSRPPRDG